MTNVAGPVVAFNMACIATNSIRGQRNRGKAHIRLLSKRSYSTFGETVWISNFCPVVKKCFRVAVAAPKKLFWISQKDFRGDRDRFCHLLRCGEVQDFYRL